VGGTEAVIAGERGGGEIAGLAAFLEEPVLLSRRFTLPRTTRDVIAELGITSVTVVGDVSQAVVGQLEGLGIEVERLDRPVEVVEASVASGVSPRAPWIVFHDGAVSAAAGVAAAETGDLLVRLDGGTGRYLLEQRRLLERLRPVGSLRGSEALLQAASG
jgi:hypothetical protein